MRLTIAYSNIKKRNLVLINNDTHQRETLSERPIRPPLIYLNNRCKFCSELITAWPSNNKHMIHGGPEIGKFALLCTRIHDP